MLGFNFGTSVVSFPHFHVFSLKLCFDLKLTSPQLLVTNAHKCSRRLALYRNLKTLIMVMIKSLKCELIYVCMVLINLQP